MPRSPYRRPPSSPSQPQPRALRPTSFPFPNPRFPSNINSTPLPTPPPRLYLPSLSLPPRAAPKPTPPPHQQPTPNQPAPWSSGESDVQAVPLHSKTTDERSDSFDSGLDGLGDSPKTASCRSDLLSLTPKTITRRTNPEGAAEVFSALFFDRCRSRSDLRQLNHGRAWEKQLWCFSDKGVDFWPAEESAGWCWKWEG